MILGVHRTAGITTACKSQQQYILNPVERSHVDFTGDNYNSLKPHCCVSTEGYNTQLSLSVVDFLSNQLIVKSIQTSASQSYQNP